MLLCKPLDFASHNIHLQVKAIEVLEFLSRSFKYRYFQPHPSRLIGLTNEAENVLLNKPRNQEEANMHDKCSKYCNRCDFVHNIQCNTHTHTHTYNLLRRLA